MRRGVLATGAINMVKPIDRRDRRNGIENEEITDPTAKPVYQENEKDDTTEVKIVSTAAPTDAIALDLDLFDPDEDD